MAERRSRKRIWPGILLSLVFVGGIVAAGLGFAKMVSNSSNVEGSILVAEWSVSADSATDGMSLVAGGVEKSYVLSLTNSSDVAAGYVVTLSNVPENVLVTLGNEQLAPSADGTVVFSGDDFVLNARSNGNATTKDVTLKFAATLDSPVVTDNEIGIDVVFMQERPRE